MGNECKIELFLRGRTRGVWVTVAAVCAAIKAQKSSVSRILREWSESGVVEVERLVNGRGRPTLAYRWKR